MAHVTYYVEPPFSNGDADEPAVFISRISMIQFDDQLNNLQMKVNNEYGEELLSDSARSQWQKDDSSKQVVDHEEGCEGSQEEHRITSTSDDKYVGNPPTTSIADLHGSSMPSTSQGLSFQSKSTGTSNDGIGMNVDMSMFGLSDLDKMNWPSSLFSMQANGRPFSSSVR
jgi:hypothetical protein